MEWVQVGEDEGVPIYSDVDVSETNDSVPVANAAEISLSLLKEEKNE